MENITAMQMLDVDAKFVLEVASGVRPPEVIAEDYGYSPEQWGQLKKFPPFVKAVDLKKVELTASGYTFRMKAAIGAEDLLTEVYKKATTGDTVSFHTQLEALKFMARAAGLETPPREDAELGSKFSITINLGGGKSVEIGVKMPENGVKMPENGVNTLECDDFWETTPLSSDWEIPYDSSELFRERV
jgi:hypothetical protein